MKKKSLLVVSILIIIAICIAYTPRSFQNDTFYTIKIGKLVMKNGIDMKDHFSWHNLSYTYPHWLYDVIIYKVYDLYNFSGLYVFTILCFIVIGISFYLINLRLNKSYFMSLLFSILGVIMLANYASARAQLFTYFLFLLEVYFIERLLSSSNKRYATWLFVICILIANMHAAVWPFYFILMLPFVAEAFIYKISNKFKWDGIKNLFYDKVIVKKEDNIKMLLIVFGISLFLGLLTPICFTPYTYFIKTLQGDTMKFIEEHKPLVLVENAFVWGYLLILLIPLIFMKVKIRLRDLFMICGLVLMAFLSSRHVSLLAVIGTIYLCRLLCSVIDISRVSDIEIPSLGYFIVLVVVIITSVFVYNINAKKSFIDEDLYPVSMVDYMYKNMDVKKIRLYNDYDFGSYLLYRDLKVYIDSRSDLYTKPFNGKFDIFDECMHITSNYGRVFNKYGITHILIYVDTDLNQILSASPNYKLVHKEGRFALFEYLSNED